MIPSQNSCACDKKKKTILKKKEKVLLNLKY